MVRWSGPSWVFSAVRLVLRQYAHPEQRCRFWKRARLRLGAPDHEGGFLIQIGVHMPLVVAVVMVVEADDHVWQMKGLVVAMVVVVVGPGGVDFWVPNVADANEGGMWSGVRGASGLPRHSQHNRHANQERQSRSNSERQNRFN